MTALQWVHWFNHTGMLTPARFTPHVEGEAN
jgi:hypothetical protein